MSDREALGRRVREIWVAWASEQPDPKPSWLEGWDDLDDGQREVDMRIGEAVAAGERERIGRILADHGRHNRPCGTCRRHGRHWVPLVNLINVILDGF